MWVNLYIWGCWPIARRLLQPIASCELVATRLFAVPTEMELRSESVVATESIAGIFGRLRNVPFDHNGRCDGIDWTGEHL